MAVIETWLHQDLQESVKVNHLDGNLFSNNGNGNRIGVVLTNNGEALASISGTVSGYVVTADGSTVPCTGSKSGNRASILIPAAAYQPGSIFITVFVTDGTTVTTIGAVSTTVMRSRTNAQVDPGSAVTDWTQTINAAMQSVETAAANLGGIVAVPYASITFPVPLGKYTYYNNNLYRCISPIASSESFTAAHWTQVRLGDEVSDLKSALESAENKILDNTSDVIQNELSIDETDNALGVSVQYETVQKTMNDNYVRDQVGRLAVANPYNINGVLKKVIYNSNIGNTAGRTGKCYCRLIYPDVMKNSAGKTLAQVPYIAEKYLNVTSATGNNKSDATNLEFDFSSENIPFTKVLYVLVYVVPDNVSEGIYIKTMRAGNPYGSFIATSAVYPNYIIQNGATTFAEKAYTENCYLPINANIQIVKKHVTIEIGNPWVNKKAVAYGSSLTANGGWTDVLKERFGFSKMYNRGSGGTTLTDLSGLGLSNYVTSITVYNDSSVWDEERTTCYYDANDVPEGYSEYAHTNTVTGWQSGDTRLATIPEDADLVIIDLCTNDFYRINGNNLDYDTYVNTPIVKTVYGESIAHYQYDVKKMGDAFANLVKVIQNRCQSAKIVVWGMLYNDTITNNNSTSLEIWTKMYEHLKKLCDMFGVYFIDMREESGMNVFNAKQYCEDGVHPYKPTYATEKGKYMVANILTKHLMQIYPKDYMTV